MAARIPEEFSTGWIDRSLYGIMGNTVPPRDPDDDEEDEDDENEDGDEENRAAEPPVVREPDED
jgi:hypothetical protein